jgi:hypothetical protein
MSGSRPAALPAIVQHAAERATSAGHHPVHWPQQDVLLLPATGRSSGDDMDRCEEELEDEV